MIVETAQQHYRTLSWTLARLGLAVAVASLWCPAPAQDGIWPLGDPQQQMPGPHPVPQHLLYIIPGESQLCTLYFDGSQVELPTEQRWRFMCGSDVTGRTLEELRAYAHSHLLALEDGAEFVVNNGTRDGGLDIVFYADASVPSEALSALALAEEYLESLFGDAFTVPINISFQNMGSGVLGATGSRWVTNVTYNNSRSGLQSGMDGDDVIQSYLPSGSTVPVRYDGNSGTITYENRIDWTRANFNATVGSSSGVAGDMTINSAIDWDWNPANGISVGHFSFVDVVCHETGHALGFVSAVDDQAAAMDAMDLYRFQLTDGGQDYNPDTYEEFQVRPRLVDYNVPNDAHISDLIAAEYRMEDGSPNQGSHFRQQTDPWIGLMDPIINVRETHFPSYYSSADKAMFDAIGYDYPRCPIFFITQPEPLQTACEGGIVQLSVTVQDGFAMNYQWRRGDTPLVDDFVHIFGATTSTLIINGFTAGDVGSDYNCLVTHPTYQCSEASDFAELVLDPDAPVITQQPQDQTVTEGGWASFSVTVTNPLIMTYQWRREGAPLSEGGRFFGTDTATLTILPVELGDAGQFDCVITSQLGAQCTVTSDAATLTVNPAGGNDCPEDLNGDERVDLADLSILLANYGLTPADPEDGDLDGDGDVDLGDLSQMLSFYGQDCPTHP